MNVQGTKKQTHSIVDFIINKRKHIEKFFIIMVIICAFLNTFVEINYDLTKYLPDTTPSQQGISVKRKEFG